MKQHHDTLIIATRGPGLVEFTSELGALLSRLEMREGCCNLLVMHTSASLVVQENADPSARRDLQAYMERLVPEGDPLYEHVAEGPDDMPAHVRSALTTTSMVIPVVDGALRLGTWQGIYLWEHRRRPHQRQIAVHWMGEWG